MTSIGIIGAGQIGGAITKQLARHGIKATISNSRGPESLREFVAVLGPSITAGMRAEAAAMDIVFVSVNWPKLPAAPEGLPHFHGRSQDAVRIDNTHRGCRRAVSCCRARRKTEDVALSAQSR